MKTQVAQFKRDLFFWLRSVLPLLFVLMVCGCVSTQSGRYPTLKQTDINVAWPMTHFRNAAYAGTLTLAEKQRVNAVYARYHAAFSEALDAAHGDSRAPTPDNVKTLANEVINVIASVPDVN